MPFDKIWQIGSLKNSVGETCVPVQKRIVLSQLALQIIFISSTQKTSFTGASCWPTSIFLEAECSALL